MKMCRVCEEAWNSRWERADYKDNYPWIHCHHEENDKCICHKDNCTIYYNTVCGKDYADFHATVSQVPKHCPECGRKL
jgi:hypothetical protein